MSKNKIKVSLTSGEFISKLIKIRNIRRGSKISRLVRHIFEHKAINIGLGMVLTSSLLLASAYPGTILAENSEEPQDAVLSIEEIPLATFSSLQYPVNSIRVTQGYRFYHPGLDLDGITGDPIRPIMAGIVESVEYSPFSYGNSIIIDHQNGLRSRYAHLSKINVQNGQTIDMNTEIGEMGATGRSFGDHLHLEVYENGSAINPMTLLPR